MGFFACVVCLPCIRQGYCSAVASLGICMLCLLWVDTDQEFCLGAVGCYCRQQYLLSLLKWRDLHPKNLTDAQRNGC